MRCYQRLAGCKQRRDVYRQQTQDGVPRILHVLRDNPRAEEVLHGAAEDERRRGASASCPALPRGEPALPFVFATLRSAG